MKLEKIKEREVNQLFDAILSLKDREECQKFFDDLCTVNEVHSIAQRLEVARLLKTGATYLKIEKETGASTATISRVKRSMTLGHGTYDIVFERLKI